MVEALFCETRDRAGDKSRHWHASRLSVKHDVSPFQRPGISKTGYLGGGTNIGHSYPLTLFEFILEVRPRGE